MTAADTIAESIRNAQADDIGWEEECTHWQIAVNAALEALGLRWDEATETMEEVTSTARVVEPRKPVDNEVVSLDSHGRPILTVGQLREMTAGLDPTEHVIIDDPANEWWLNVASVGIPNEARDPWSAVTLIAGDTFDSRQF